MRCRYLNIIMYICFVFILTSSYLCAMNDEHGFENIERKLTTNKKLVSLKAFSQQEALNEPKRSEAYFQLSFSKPKNNMGETFTFAGSFMSASNNTILLNPNSAEECILNSRSNLVDFEKSKLAELSIIELCCPTKKSLLVKGFNYKKDSCIANSLLYYLYSFLERYAKISFCDYLLIPKDYIEGMSFLINEVEFEKNESGEVFFKKIIPLSLNTDSRFVMYGKAPITILTGTSTAGKTTLLNLFRKFYPKFVDYSIDLFCDKAVAKTIKKFHEVEYFRIAKVLETKSMIQFILGDNVEEIPNNILNDLLLLKSIYVKGIPRNERSYFKSKIYRLPFKIWKESQNGSPVIMDFKFLNLFEMFWNLKASFTLVWVFCPLKTLSDRLKIRNLLAEQDKKLSNKRSSVALLEYAELYHKKVFPHEVTLEILKQKVAIECFQNHFPGSNTQAITDFLEKLGFESSNTEQIEITFRQSPFLFTAEKYLLIDTSLERITKLIRE